MQGSTLSLLLHVRQSAPQCASEDVVVETTPDASAREVAAAIARHLALPVDNGGGDVTLASAHLGQIDPNASPLDAGLRSGDTVTVARVSVRPGPQTIGDEAEPASLELLVTGGPQAGRRFRLRRGRHLIGRDADCDIAIPDRSVSRQHLELHVDLDALLVRDLGSTNGSTLESRRLPPGTSVGVSAGASMQIGQTTLVIASCNRASGGQSPRDGTIAFNRPPRITTSYCPPVLSLDAPPSEPVRGSLQLGAALLPLVLGAAFAAIVRQPAMLLFALLTPATLLWSHFSEQRSGRRGFHEHVGEYRKSVHRLAKELEAAHANEIRARRAAAPDAAELGRRARGVEPELWERRPGDADFLALRLGVANQPVQLRVDSPPAAQLPAGAARLLDHYRTAPSVPVVVPLPQAHAIGVAGPARGVDELARWLVVQVATLHSPCDVSIAAALGGRRREAWDWLKWLPHARTDPAVLAAPRLAGHDARSRELLERAANAVRERRDGEHHDTLVLVIDGEIAPPGSAVSEIIERGPDVGIYTIWLGRTRHSLPGGCRRVAELNEESARLTLVNVDTGEDVTDVALDRVDQTVADEIARSLAGVTDIAATTRAGDIPRSVSLLDVIGEPQPSADAVRSRWRRRTHDLAAPIGAAAGELVTVDLRADGPHALIAGTTGAGKSELLLSLVAALAVQHSPRRLSFLLVDYKGGTAFRECERLPHTVGVVTDLDAGLAQRVLVSLNAELRRREALLTRAAARDLREMERADPERAPATLVIVVDEFATLAKEVPEFVDGVVDVAQRGRALGVHLVLATQRPAGVVTEQVRANTNLRIALRVASVADSDDVVGAAAAAAIPRSSPGRAVMRTGPNELVEFQAAYASASAADGRDRSRRAVVVAHFGWEREYSEATVTIRSRGSEPTTQLQQLIEAIRRANDEDGLEPVARPWLPPLPESLPLERFDEASADTRPAAGRIAIGMLDEPQHQRQRPLVIDLAGDGSLLVLGTASSGKTTALRTIAATLARGASPDEVHLYGLDCATRSLAGLEVLPHCGSVVPVDDVERVHRLLAMLRRTIEERKRADAPQAPRLVLLLDDYGGFVSKFERADGGALIESLTRIVAEGRTVGVHVVATADRRASVPSAVWGLIARKIALRMASVDDYAGLGLDLNRVRTGHMPPGRAYTDGGLSMQCAIAANDAERQQEGLERIAAATVAAVRAPAVGRLPRHVEPDRLPRADRQLAAYIGLSGDDLSPRSISLADAHFLVAGSYRSGRTTALCAVVIGLRASTPALETYLFAPRRNALCALDSWTDVATTEDAAAALAARLADLARSRESAAAATPVAVVIDDAGELADSPAAASLEVVVRRGRDVGIRVIAGIETQTARSAWAAWIKDLRNGGHGLLLAPDVDADGGVFGVRLPRMSWVDFPPGRGYLIGRGSIELLQVAQTP